MLFNSLEFAIFLPIVFSLYWLCAKNLKFQNVIIIISSYFFYGWWDWRFLILILVSTLEDYFVAIKIFNSKNEKSKKLWLLTSIFVNLGILCFFKYYNFFIGNFAAVFSIFGTKANISSLNIILPVGISFYTFQTMSYTIDVYRNKIKPTRDILAFAAFVSFFPLLVAGPIERASNFLTQFFYKRSFNYEKSVDGLRQILWGLFKKMAVADNCAYYVNHAFANYQNQSGITLLFGAVLFSFQIYCDFSGYSDIAIGTSRLFGFNAMQNFNFPYFSRNIAEFWRRWHISLTTWFRDYVYIPLGGSRVSKMKIVRNTFFIFILSGFWHGADWTFIIWGIYHAILFLPLILLKRNRQYTDTVSNGKLLPDFMELMRMFFTFFLVLAGWIIFRADNIAHAIGYIKGIFNISLFSNELYTGYRILKALIPVSIMLAVEWIGRQNQYGLEKIGICLKPVYRYLVYYFLIILTVLLTERHQDFIYFQF
jgi:D-alanyl-lipoteichoic acid acyltransferase DltB (MBOAT superfamily)